MAPLPDPLPLRAHDVLCFLGFRGEGYSPSFVTRMEEVARALAADPARRVRLLAEPATLCEACPHHREGCTLGGPDHEAHMEAQDRDVLDRLGLEPGAVLPWSELLDRVRTRIRGTDLPAICTTCPWLSLGWCAEGLDALGKDPPGQASKATEAPMLARAAPRSTRPDRALQAAWVARLRDRDEDALREVIEAYGERITAVVSGLLRDRSAVEDVVQATFTKAWFRIDSFKGNASLYTWLYRVAVNAAKDYVKARSRRPLAPLDEQAAGRIPADEPHVVEGLERRELRLAVRRAIAALPERYRTVLALRELEGLTYEEIAEVLDLSLGTVESRLFRARRRLQATLEIRP